VSDLTRRRHVRRAALLCAALFSVASAALMGVAASEPWAFARELAAARGSGWIALCALLGSLSITPTMRALDALGRDDLLPSLTALRRGLGISAALTSLAHALLAHAGVLRANLSVVFASAHLRAGAVALGILLVLCVTSFPKLVALLRIRFWKELHRLAYVAALLVLAHVLLSPWASRTLVLLVFGGCFVWGGWRFRQQP